MSSNIQLLRNARLWVSTAPTQAAITKLNTKEILLQDDLSFSQGTSTSDVSLDEAGYAPARGSARFNEALDPVEWSFSTYTRAFQELDLNGDGTATDSGVLALDSILWHCLAGSGPYDPADPTNSVASNAANMIVNFEDNQVHTLTTFTIYIMMGSVWYKISNCQVGQAEISFDISAITMAAWSGSGTKLETLPTQPFEPASTDYKLSDAIFNSATYIKNKLTVIKCKDNKDSVEYVIPITGGSMTISNNITYLTPSTLSRVDQAIGSFTGSFEVTGSLTAYLRNDTGAGDKYTAELLAKMQGDTSTTNSFEFAICLGGISSKAVIDNTNTATQLKNPLLMVLLPTCHLSTPTVESGDVIGTSIEFKAIPSSFGTSDSIYIGITNDANAGYVANFIANQDMNIPV